MRKLTRLRNDVIIMLIVLGILAIGSALLYAVSIVFNPLLLLLIVPAWILYYLVKPRVMRYYSLRHHGYFVSRTGEGECKYEECIMGELLGLSIKIENTEPGHWELFVPTESEWCSIAPIWAMNRRIEIIGRITPIFRDSDVHFPDDYKK